MFSKVYQQITSLNLKAALAQKTDLMIFYKKNLVHKCWHFALTLPLSSISISLKYLPSNKAQGGSSS